MIHPPADGIQRIKHSRYFRGCMAVIWDGTVIVQFITAPTEKALEDAINLHFMFAGKGMDYE